MRFRAGDHYGWGLLRLSKQGASFEARRSLDGALVDAVHVAVRPPPEAAAYWAALAFVAVGLGLTCCCCCLWRRVRLADEEEKSALKGVTYGNSM